MPDTSGGSAAALPRRRAVTSKQQTARAARRPAVSATSATSQSGVPDDTSTQPLHVLLDRNMHSMLAAMTGGISPVSLALAYRDWLLHLALAPGKQMEIVTKVLGKGRRLTHYIADCASKQAQAKPCITPLPQDRRFADPGWHKFPFNIMHQSFLLTQQLWHNATTGVPGVSRRHQQVVEFYSRQLLDMVAPSNFLHTNPELMRITAEQGGLNLVRGFINLLDDTRRQWLKERPAGSEAFGVGVNVAVTPGTVVLRNELIELIQYSPTTPTVRPEPILIVPAWIMKYYILDLSPQNSLIRHLVDQGFTVFAISWRNPGSDQRDLALEDYRTKGVLAAIDAVNSINGTQPIHAVGYCLGGTLLLIAASAMAREHDNRLASISLLAAQADFSEAGELTLFIDESQVALIEDLMWRKGYLDARRMLGAFQFLRSQDLIWSRMVQDYLRGVRRPPSDLMAWNSDATRMPFRMHSQYLRQLFLNNDLAEGRFKVNGRPIFLEDIAAPVFMVATERDHVAPWQSVFKLNSLLDTETTFLLTTGGHNTGIVSPPGKPGRSYKVADNARRTAPRDPDAWIEAVPSTAGSWWPEWLKWLTHHSSTPCPPPGIGNTDAGYPPLGPAPGTYVLQQ